MSNLLKEAIADAKAVRATALANAKVALEEAFTPRFHAMFADKLKEEAGAIAPTTEAPLAEEEDVQAEAQDVDALIKELEAEVGMEEEEAMPVAPEADEVPVDDMAPEAPVDDMAPEAEGEPLKAGQTVQLVPVAAGAEEPVPPVEPTEEPVGVPGAEDDEEVDLNELLESLKAEAELEEETVDEEKEEIAESVPAKTSGIGTADNKNSPEFVSSKIGGQVTGGATDGVPGGKKTAEDPTEASRPNQAKNATKDNLSTPGGMLKEDTGGATPGVPGGKKTSTGDDPTETDRPNKGEHATKDDLSTPGGALNELKAENKKLKKQLAEATETVTYIKGQLNEINLLNAKLLYTNKLFKEYSMDNEQKMRVVEMFDLSKNVREVKLTYATIAESLNFSGNSRKKTSSSVKSITEGIASKPVGSTKPTEKKIIAESAMVSKFQKLAGIKSK